MGRIRSAPTSGPHEGEPPRGIPELVESIVDMSPQVRFAAAVGMDGRILAGILRSGRASLKSQRDEERFCRQVAKRRRMRDAFDASLGKVSYVHIEREKVSQFVVYLARFTVYFTVEPESSIASKAAMIKKVRRMCKKIGAGAGAAASGA